MSGSLRSGLGLIFVLLFSSSAYAAEPSPLPVRDAFSTQVEAFLKKTKAPGAGQENRDSFVLTSVGDTDALLRLFETSPLTPLSTQQAREALRLHPDDPAKLDAAMLAPGRPKPVALFDATRILVWSGLAQKRDDAFKKRVVAGVARVMNHDLRGPVTLIEAVVAIGSVCLLAEPGWIGPNKLPIAQELEKDGEAEKRRVQSDLKEHSGEKKQHAIVLLREMSVATALMTRAAQLLR